MFTEWFSNQEPCLQEFLCHASNPIQKGEKRKQALMLEFVLTYNFLKIPNLGFCPLEIQIENDKKKKREYLAWVNK